ncbi:MAG: NYN domain-containing protein [Candidatus Puniceispirillaceae bacterium]
MASLPRVIAFFDEQNLYHSSKSAFPNASDDYNPKALATLIAKRQGWHLVQTRFYTAIPDQNRDRIGAKMWHRRLLRMNRDGCKTTARILRYDESGRGREKGIDIRIALDLIRLTLNQHMDVALVFSQDQDFAEVASELRLINKKTGYFVRIASAFPNSELANNKRGINGADWLRFDIHDWNNCLY